MFNVPYKRRSKQPGLVSRQLRKPRSCRLIACVQKNANTSDLVAQPGAGGGGWDSQVLPNKISYRHSQMQISSVGWEAISLTPLSLSSPKGLLWNTPRSLDPCELSLPQLCVDRPLAPWALVSVCTCDHWEAIWLSLKCADHSRSVFLGHCNYALSRPVYKSRNVKPFQLLVNSPGKELNLGTGIPCSLWMSALSDSLCFKTHLLSSILTFLRGTFLV